MVGPGKGAAGMPSSSYTMGRADNGDDNGEGGSSHKRMRVSVPVSDDKNLKHFLSSASIGAMMDTIKTSNMDIKCFCFSCEINGFVPKLNRSSKRNPSDECILRADINRRMAENGCSVLNVLDDIGAGNEYQPTVVYTDASDSNGVVRNVTYPGVDVDVVERYRAPEPTEGLLHYRKSGRHWKWLGFGGRICKGKTLSSTGVMAWRDFFAEMHAQDPDPFMLPMFQVLWPEWKPPNDN